MNTLGLTVHKLPLLVLFSLALPSLDCLELPIGAGDFSSIIPHLLLKRSELQKSSSQIFTNFVNLSIADPSFDNLAVTLKQKVEISAKLVDESVLTSSDFINWKFRVADLTIVERSIYTIKFQ